MFQMGAILVKIKKVLAKRNYGSIEDMSAFLLPLYKYKSQERSVVQSCPLFTIILYFDYIPKRQEHVKK